MLGAHEEGDDYLSRISLSTRVYYMRGRERDRATRLNLSVHIYKRKRHTHTPPRCILTRELHLFKCVRVEREREIEQKQLVDTCD